MTTTETISNNGYELPPPQIYSKSIKLESTAKGLRIHAHCYGNDSVQLRKDILSLYCDMEQDLIDKKITDCKNGGCTLTILLRVCRACSTLIIYNDPSPENYVDKKITMQCPECGSLESWKEKEAANEIIEQEAREELLK